MNTRTAFWWRWLVTVTVGVTVFGISMVLIPNVINRFFSLLMFSSPKIIEEFERPAVSYILLLQGVLGSVMFGWGISLLFLLFSSFRRGSREGWLAVSVSVASWFVPDTSFSLLSGFWQNAVLNLVFAVAFAIPLAATYRSFSETGKGISNPVQLQQIRGDRSN